MRTPIEIFQALPIRFKMFYTYSVLFSVMILFGGLSVFLSVGNTLEQKIESELSNATERILNMVRTTANASVKNYLRAVAEKNYEIVSLYHKAVLDGDFTQEEAQSKLRKILSGQKIGRTGYIYCLDSNGTAVVHPNSSVAGHSFTQFEFIREQMQRKDGYLEYEWKNPEEDNSRPKALYMTYFEPWDWIISVSSYREEFSELINISNFKDSIMSLKFGRSGYSYVIDSTGQVIVHPFLSGNLYDARDADGQYLVRHQCETKNGKLIYSWRNPGEKIHRKKIVIYNYIPEYDWIVASSGYLEELYEPLKSVRNIFLLMFFVILILVIPATLFIAGGITGSLKQLEKQLIQGADGDFTGRMSTSERDSNGAGDEIRKLAVYYNSFMDRLEQYKRKIEAEASERKIAAESLKKSEEKYRTILENIEDGYFEIDNQDRFVFFNSSMMRITGFSDEDLKTLTREGISAPKGADRIRKVFLRLWETTEACRAMEWTILKNDGTFCHTETSLSVIPDSQGRIVGIRGVMRDVTEKHEAKRLEQEIIDISERERMQIGQYLHDDLSSHLLGIEVMHSLLEKKLTRLGYAELVSVGKIRGLVLEAIDKIGRISRGLCPVNIVEQGLEFALRELCYDIEKIYNVACILNSGGYQFRKDDRAAVHIYYIAREAAFNAVKHGLADTIRLNLEKRGNRTRLEIRDNGSGLPENIVPKGMGLRIMQYRARRIGAILEARGSKDSGSVISLTFND
ncbi:MAG: hypothetical protein A2277_15915 [Desulfobacterales bacterium RIFOXYA12_FULL_46_15]|nr:MAG: hypothetical protein A2277_15915 [Desulfobacterales bacterium RIFOXYA12_FULL_46_15]